MVHLNAQVQQYDGFAPGEGVFGRAPKTSMGTAGVRILRISRFAKSPQ